MLFPIVYGGYQTVVLYNEPDILNFSFTVSEEGIESYSILDLGLMEIQIGSFNPPITIAGGEFTIDIDTISGTTRISRVFEGTFVAPDKIEGTYEFKYGGKTYEGEWVGRPKE